MLDAVVCLSPIAFLIATSAFTRLDPSKTLVVAAILMFFVRTMYLASDPLQASAAVIAGLHEALIPISILVSALFLFKAMESTKCLQFMIEQLTIVTGGDKVQQLMLLGVSFMTLLEGCSGFSTPIIAIAPVLVALGHDTNAAIQFLLISNSLVTAFGAAGTPIWYGLKAIPEEYWEDTAFFAGICLAVLSFIFIPVACSLATSIGAVRKQWKFVLAGTAATFLPLAVSSFFSFTFPAIIGGFVGCVVLYALVRYQKGPSQPVSKLEALKKTSPIVGTVILLLMTRIDAVGLKGLLTRTTPSFTAYLGTYGDVNVSASLVFQLLDVLTVSEVDFKFQILYVPCTPLFIAGLFTLAAFKSDKTLWRVTKDVVAQVGHPAMTLLSALVLAELLIVGGESSPAYIIGDDLSTAVGDAWIVIAPFVGSIGSFVAGSSTVSNLTFSVVQYVAALNIGFDVASILALQTVGASVGSSICIFHVIAAAAAVGRDVSLRTVLRTLAPLVLFGNLLSAAIVYAIQAI
jgi:lactate permease